VLGTLTPDWMRRTGLSGQVQVYCGLHDSNAALYAARGLPQLRGHDSTVLSTGTWFVAMRSPLPASAPRMMLTETRDCLVNVDVEGAPVPSARFMGGREIEVLLGAHPPDADELAGRESTAQGQIDKLLDRAVKVIEAKEMQLPAAVPGVGPFPNAKRTPLNGALEADEARVRAHVYAALVADVSLDLIGSCDTLLIDGRFARSAVFVSTLAALRPDTTVLTSHEEHGVARGALRVIDQILPGAATPEHVTPLAVDLSRYRAAWREAAERVG
jgi:sugar (pentulose or hexulose) kinase